MSAEVILTFQSQLSGIMETVLRAAVHEITCLVEDSFKGEMVRSEKEVETLRRRLQWFERRWREGGVAAKCVACSRAGVSSEDVEQVPMDAQNEEKDYGLKENCALDGDWCEGSWGASDQEQATIHSPIGDPETALVETDRIELLHIKKTVKYTQEPRCSNVDVPIARNDCSHNTAHNASDVQNLEKDLSVRDTEEGQHGKVVKAEPKDVCVTADAELNQIDFGDSLFRGNQMQNRRPPGHIKAELDTVNAKIRKSDKSVQVVSSDNSNIAASDQSGSDSRSSPNHMDVRVLFEKTEHSQTPERHDGRPSGAQLENKEAQTRHKSQDCEFWVPSHKCTEDYLTGSYMENYYSCPYCRHTYSDLIKLNLHLQSHCAERLYSSSELQKTYQQWDGKQDSPYSCYCGKKFNSTGTLERHQKVHREEVMHRCAQCGKTFNRAYNLKIHQRSHTGERPYLCTHCKKGFISPTDLRRHKRIHTGEKPYACILCGSKFSQSWSLKIHQRIHTQEKPHCCLQCGKCFRCSGDLSKHMRVHTGEKPYICELCGKRYSQSQNLKSHRCCTQLQADNCQGGC